MKQVASHEKTVRLTVTALLSALILIFTFTGIGYIPIGPLTLTVLTLPVAVGACLLGPWGGLLLGGVFGVSSFITCFGMDMTGTLLLGINPFTTLLTCLVPRLLCGFLVGLIYRGLSRYSRMVAGPVACLSAAVLNTVLFLSTMWLFFSSVWQEQGFSNLWLFFVGAAGVNALVEAAANLVIGGAVVVALQKALRR